MNNKTGLNLWMVAICLVLCTTAYIVIFVAQTFNETFLFGIGAIIGMIFFSILLWEAESEGNM